MKYAVTLIVFAGFTGLLASAHAKEYEVVQKNKQFSQKKLAIKVGDIVSFKNEDNVSHNVFSLSEPKTFDLGSYPQGQTKKVTFDRPGTVEVECAIHPDMLMTVEVEK